MDFNALFVYDDGFLYNRKTGKLYASIDANGYNRFSYNSKNYYVHRVVWEMHNGPIPEGMHIDHEDLNRANNRLSNLRLATRQQNSANSKVAKSRKHNLPKGVDINPSSGKFLARIKYDNVLHYLGSHDTVEEAKAAYDEAADILFGDYARK